jgi:phage terminase large subunit-like protein
VLSPYGQMVHTRLIEDTANGPAILDTLRSKISGLKAINPRTSKEARARAITPEVESGNVFLPYPGDPGNDWVMDLTSELRNFPFDAHDDQVDAMTQALTELRGVGLGQITVPGRQPGSSIPRTIPQGRASAAMTDRRRTGGR